MQLETAVCTTDSSVEKYLRPAGGLSASDLGNKERNHLEPERKFRGSCVTGEIVCGGRGKKVRTLAGAFEPIFTMTETRAACCSGVACASQPSNGQVAAVEPKSPRDGGGQGTQGGLVLRLVYPARSRRSCGLVDPLGRCDPVRVLVAVGQGQPCVLRKLARPAARSASSKEVGPAQRVPIKRPTPAVMEGGNSYPSCIEQALSLRDTQGGTLTYTRVRPASGGNIVSG